MFHVAVGAAMAWLVEISIVDVGKTVVVPLAGVFVGLSFAWVGSALAILSTPEIDSLADNSDDGLEAYAYSFQLAVLILLLATVAWGIAAVGVFERPCFWRCSSWAYSMAKGVLFGLLSMSIRECWHVVAGSQTMLLYQSAVAKLNRAKADPPSDR